MALTYQFGDEFQFAQYKEDWNQLLKSSDAHPLFSSWEWSYFWWKTWNRELNLKLRLISIYEGSRLVGLIPFHTRQVSYLLSKTERVEFLGNCLYCNTIRTEYCGPIFANDKGQELADFFCNAILPTHFSKSQFVFSDINCSEKKGSAYLLYSNLLSLRKSFAYQLCSNISYFVESCTNFDAYLSKLTRSTKRSLLKAKTRIGDLHSRELQQLGKEQIDFLNACHKSRFGQNGLCAKAINFHLSVSSALNKDSDIETLVSELYEGKRLISLSYNFKVGKDIFNIQSGFLPEYNKCSIGYFHIGNLISLLHREKYKRLYLLAGNGKKTDYKARICNQGDDFISVIISQSRAAKVFYVMKSVKSIIRKNGG